MIYICIITHARTALLQQAVASAMFIPDSTIVVMNDCPWQTLSCAIPRVQIINKEIAFSDVGAKRIALAREIPSGSIAQWLDDDDIILPWAIERIMKTRKVSWANPIYQSVDYFAPVPDIGYTCINFAGLIDIVQEQTSLRAPEDLSMRNLYGKNETPDMRPDYVLRRHKTTAHLSQIDGMSSNPGAFQREAEKRRDAGAEPSGNIVITPDYSAWQVIAMKLKQ